MSRQLVTSSENLVAGAQFLVALVTSELKFRTLILLNVHVRVQATNNNPQGQKDCQVQIN